MLQQTRAQVVIPYYLRFLERFPTARALAEAPEAEVLACWSGLGYYSRARNLQRAARAIVQGGVFPPHYEGIRSLPGAGPYTAAAVASIAFGEPRAVLDGNVLRVIARLHADGANIQSQQTRMRFQQIADELLDHGSPGRFNQAMIDAGVMLSGDGLHPPAKAARVSFKTGKPVVTEGPFAEAREVLGGYWIIEVGSREEAVEWVKKCPAFPGDVIEIRQIFEPDEFPG